MERMWQERADYGHFFYRIPNGESAADAYDRVSGFNESLWRQFGDDDFASVCVLVTHGLMSRVFLMKWYHFTVEYFEDLRNVDHCEFLIMRKQDNGKYNLETKLRTWSELKRERAAALKEKGKDKDDKNKDQEANDEVELQRNKTFVVTRHWGGCPDGCNHTSKYVKRHDLESLRQKDIEQAAASSRKSANAHHRHRQRLPISSDDEADDHVHHHHNHTHKHNGTEPKTAEAESPVLEITRTSSRKTMQLEDGVQPSTMSPQFVHLGRDFGGSYSGHTSVVDSDSERPDDGDDDSEAAHSTKGNGGLSQRRRKGSILNSIEARLLQATISSHHGRKHSISSMGSNTAPSSPGISPFVNRLGDAPLMTDSEGNKQPTTTVQVTTPQTIKEEPKTDATVGVEGMEGFEDIEAAEARDRSIEGSVY